MPIPSGATKQSQLDGFPLYYERHSSTDQWGDLAEGEKFSPYFNAPFYRELSSSFTALFALPHFPQPTGIITGGVWVEKPGAHGEGRGFDLDGMVWSATSRWRASDYGTPNERKLYLALMCHFMRSFGNVLGRHYNNAHMDHLHIDNMTPPGFRSNSRAVVTTIQACLLNVWARDVPVVDGLWGPATRAAMRGVVVEFTGVYPTQDDYYKFITMTRDKGLEHLRSVHQTLPSPVNKTPVTTDINRNSIETHLRTIESLVVEIRRLNDKDRVI